MKNFEKLLIEMSKPEVSKLKHQEMIENVIKSAKDKSVLSWWWILIPVYIIAALLMKTFYMPGTDLMSGLHELTSRKEFSSMLFFLIVPFIIIIFNLISIRRVYYLSGSPGTVKFLQTVWFNLLMILLSFTILIIYLL